MYPELFGFIDTYSVMILIGVLFCLWFLSLYLKKKNYPKQAIYAIELNAIVAILVGVVTGLLFQNLYDFIEKGSAYTWTWAMTFYGGLIGGVASFLIGYFAILRRKHFPMVSELLVIAPSCICIAHGIGRIGCFLAGCCYGKETDAWYGVRFPGMDHKVIPTNLFEAIFLIALALLLLILALKEKGIFNFGIYMVAYGVWRFIVEFWRGDHRGEFIGNLSPSQFWSIVLFVGGVAYFVIMGVLLAKGKAPKPKDHAAS